MSESNKEFSLTIVKIASEISYEKPKPSNNLVDSKEYEKVDNAISTSVAITNAGTTLVNEKELPTLISEPRKDTNYIIENIIPDSAKVNINNSKYIKSCAVIALTQERSEEHRDAKKRAINQYTAQSIMNISNSSDTKAQKGDFEDYAKKKERTLGKIRAETYNITNDEITGEPLEGSGDYHHKNKKTIYTDPVQRLDPQRGALLNKSTHNMIHKKGINDDKSFDEIQNEYNNREFQ